MLVSGQNCPPIDHAAQARAEQECRAASGQWARHGVLDHLCVTEAPARIGAEAAGKCTAVKTSYGCFTHVDAGRIVGRVCTE